MPEPSVDWCLAIFVACSGKKKTDENVSQNRCQFHRGKPLGPFRPPDRARNVNYIYFSLFVLSLSFLFCFLWEWSLHLEVLI